MPDPEIPNPQAMIEPAALPSETIFRGPQGIRAGWRVLIFLALIAGVTIIFAIPFVLINLANKSSGGQITFGTSGLTPVGLSISEGVLFVIPSIAALIMARIERRKYG